MTVTTDECRPPALDCARAFDCGACVGAGTLLAPMLTNVSGEGICSICLWRCSASASAHDEDGHGVDKCCIAMSSGTGVRHGIATGAANEEV